MTESKDRISKFYSGNIMNKIKQNNHDNCSFLPGENKMTQDNQYTPLIPLCRHWKWFSLS